MQRERYTPLSNSAHDTYEFLSSGPRGTIKKVVHYTALTENVYNIGFGDWDEDAQAISDAVRSNNEDRDKVLATVASTIFDFIQYHPVAVITATGSTAARTRLYQIGISNNLAQIRPVFEVYGFVNGHWEPFQKDKNYQIFALKAK